MCVYTQTTIQMVKNNPSPTAHNSSLSILSLLLPHHSILVTGTGEQLVQYLSSFCHEWIKSNTSFKDISSPVAAYDIEYINISCPLHWIT